jgi:D-arabinose 1-dehydrogenase-like Zn-dependent alcohol dehydrogenase
VAFQRPGELREVPIPEPGPGEVLVKIGGAGACHSDLHIMEMRQPAGNAPFSLPVTLGHENAGWVEQLGPGTTGFGHGDPVIVYGPWGCGLCLNCHSLSASSSREKPIDASRSGRPTSPMNNVSPVSTPYGTLSSACS